MFVVLLGFPRPANHISECFTSSANGSDRNHYRRGTRSGYMDPIQPNSLSVILIYEVIASILIHTFLYTYTLWCLFKMRAFN